MATPDSTHVPPFGKLIDIPFTSDTPSETRLRAGTFVVFEEVIADAIVILATPAGPSKPIRLLVTFDHALEMSHALIAAAARLHRAGGSGHG